MNFILAGGGKTGSLVAEVARQRGHQIRIVDIPENAHAAALTRDALRGVDAVIDFTAPDAVLENIEACARAGANMVVGTTGWYDEIPRVRELVAGSGIGFLYASNFSIGVNLFYDIVRAAAPAFRYGYSGSILERHHVHKKDAPSGTAVKMRNIIEEAGAPKLEITSVRQGETVGMHVLLLDSANDSMMLTHDAKSRRGFAEGAVRAAEWIQGKKGFFDFKDVFRELK
jgi:4-hydroxy-tetrahydrodipicolinate reductase